jgi:hypothetical protein
MFTPDNYDFSSEREALVNVLTAFLEQSPSPDHPGETRGRSRRDAAPRSQSDGR